MVDNIDAPENTVTEAAADSAVLFSIPIIFLIGRKSRFQIGDRKPF